MRSVILSLVMVLGIGSLAFAQTSDAEQEKALKALRQNAEQRAKPPTPPEKNEKFEKYTFEMRRAPWASVFERLTDITGKPIVGSGSPAGTFNFVPPKDSHWFTIPEIIDIINDGLLSQKWLLLNRGSSFTLVPADEKIDPSLLVRVPIEQLTRHGKTEVVQTVYQCKSLTAEEVAPEVKKQMGPFGEIVVLQRANQLVMQDSVANLTRIKKSLDEQEKGGKLNELISKALKNNPDVRVAEAKLREAEAELNRVRHTVLQKVVGAHADLQAARAIAAEAEMKYQTGLKLMERRAIPAEEWRSAILTRDKMVYDAEAKQAALDFLTGSGVSSSADLLKAVGANDLGHDELALLRAIHGQRNLAWLREFVENPKNAARSSDKEGQTPFRAFAPAGSTDSRLPAGMAEKIRGALNSTAGANYSWGDTKPDVVLNSLQERLKVINLIVQAKLDKAPNVSVQFKEPVPLGAVFQFLEDHYGWRFVVRDYGIVVAEPGRVPPGAVYLLDVWKSKPAEGKAGQ